jgi:hypothetical protein
MKKFLLGFLLFSATTLAQTVTIPANSLVFSTVATISTVGPTVSDSQGNKWSITSSGQVQINSQSLTQTANVVEISFVNGSIWQLNKAGTWYEATGVTGTVPNQTVTWSTGTSTSPITSANFVTVTGPTLATTLPVTGVTSGLPAGMTYSSTTGLNVVGPAVFSGQVTASQVSLTGGPALPACPSLLYVYQYAPSTNILSPVCLPLLTVNAPY